MGFIKEFYEKRKIAKQILNTYKLGGFEAIEDSLAKLVNEREDIAIYLFKYINGIFGVNYDFFSSVMKSKKIVFSSNIIASSIPNRYLYIYFNNHKDVLTTEQIISILEENFDSYYDNYAEDLYRIINYATDSKYYDTINSLIIKYPTYESAYYIRSAMRRSKNYSDEMIDAMIATNNLEELQLLKKDILYNDFNGDSISKKLDDKLNESEEKKFKHSHSKTDEKKTSKLQKSKEKLDECIKNL